LRVVVKRPQVNGARKIILSHRFRGPERAPIVSAQPLSVRRQSLEAGRLGKALQRHAFLACWHCCQQRTHRRIVGDGAAQHDVAGLAPCRRAAIHTNTVDACITPSRARPVNRVCLLSGMLR